MRSSEFTSLQRRQMAKLLDGRLATDPVSGCRTPVSKSTTIRAPDGRHLFLRKAAWMLAYGETPQRYLRTTCRTVGCCCVEHLTDDPLTNVRTQGMHLVRKRYYMTPAEQREAYRLRFDDKMRITDIAKRLKFAFSTVQRAIEREKAVRKEASRQRPDSVPTASLQAANG